jgi:hypothetical protein
MEATTQKPTQNAFIGHTARPTALEVATALGPSAACWTQLIDWLADAHGILIHEWKSDSLRYGWSLRLKRKDRTILYLAPCKGCFRVSFVFGSRAMEIVHQTQFPPAVTQAIAEAPHYAEGTGIRLIVHRPSDLLPVRTLAEIKLAS